MNSAKSPGRVRRCFARIGRVIAGGFSLVSLIVLLAVLAAVPIAQLITLGYLLAVAGRLASGATVSESIPHRAAAGKIGLAGIAIMIAALPTQMLAHLESVATIIDPDSSRAVLLRFASLAAACFTMAYLMWAWVRGGRLWHYLWPQPSKFFREAFRWRTWSDFPDRLWAFLARLQIPHYFSLGLRGAIGTLVWLIPAMVVAAALSFGQTGLAGLVGGLALVVFVVVLMYLPMLQTRFAAEDRFSAMFEVREVRRRFRRAPWSWLVAVVLALAVLPIPLYLLKIEATPREVMWLPCVFFVAFALPARVALGWAMRRSERCDADGDPVEPVGAWAALSRWGVRLVMPLVVGVYVAFVYGSQFTSWDGLLTWVGQHAVLLPVPFFNGT